MFDPQLFACVMAVIGVLTPLIVAIWRLASRVAMLEFQVNQFQLPTMPERILRIESEMRSISGRRRDA